MAALITLNTDMPPAKIGVAIFEHEEDMWNAFNNVNRRLYEQERYEDKAKDKEVKRRTKEDLDNQIKHKLLRLEEDKIKNSEYHTILVKHIDNLNGLEDEKQARIKSKVMKEKEKIQKLIKLLLLQGGTIQTIADTLEMTFEETEELIKLIEKNKS